MILKPLVLAAFLILNFSNLYAGSIWRVDTSYPVIALTFDDGPKPEHTQPLLRILEAHDVRATFFVVGQTLDAYPDLAHQLTSYGHELANHSYSHPNMTHLSERRVDEELQKTSESIKRFTQASPQYFRPPGGKHNDFILNRVTSHNMVTAFWDVNAADYAHETLYGVKNALNLDTLVEQIVPGSIVLMHNGNPFTLAQLPDFIQRLRDKGFQMVPLRELVTYAN